MSSPVRDAIATELALLEQERSVPSEPLGYGRDLSLAVDLTADMASVDPLSTQGISEAIVRRLDCPRGALPDDPDYGIDLRGALNRGTTTAALRALAGQVRAEVTKDDRIDSVTVTVAPAPVGSSLRVALVVTPIDPRTGRFRLVLTATDAELLLEEITSA